MTTPNYLNKGDTIAIIATARKIERAKIHEAIDIFNEWGLNVLLGDHLFAEYNQFAGNDNERRSDLQKMLNDTSVKAIIIARGGYGTARIIDDIDFSNFEKQPKWIIGFSDITVLHSHLNRKEFASLHATMPINFSKNDSSLTSLKDALFGKKLTYNFTSHILNRKGEAHAEIVGGNLSILNSMLGSNSDINTNGKILFLEDLDEYLYHIDRIMISLKRAKKLSNLAGLVIGHMNDMNDNAIPFGKSVEEIISEAVEQYNYPICFNFPAGHLEPNIAIRLGTHAKLSVGENETILSY